MDKVPWDKLIDAGVIGLTVTVILALVGWISSVLKEWMDRRRKARYLAVRIVPIIDQFLNDCSACLGDDGLLFGNADENGYTPPREKLPSKLIKERTKFINKMMSDIEPTGKE